MKLRGYLTLGCVGLVLLSADVVERSVITLALKILPSKRSRILGWWQKLMAHTMIGLVRRVGGGDVEDPPPIPSHPGVLILMNHQSLLDIPLVVAAVDDLYPRIVTRARYAHGKPLISHMVRLYQYPLVDPRATTRKHLKALRAAATENTTPLVVFPEGTRTRDGEIGPWKRRGLERVLGSRSWEVYILVADGFWRTAKLPDFLESVSTVKGRSLLLGPFFSPEPGQPLEPFIDDMRAQMKEGLLSLRSAAPA